MSDTNVPSGFPLVGTPNPVAPLVVRQDDIDPPDGVGFSVIGAPGSWLNNPLQTTPPAVGNNAHRHDATAGDVATWNLSAPADGWYAVQATWPASSDQVGDAVYTVFKNGSPLPGSPVTKNQSSAPGFAADTDPAYPGIVWANVVPGGQSHAVYLQKGDSVTVQLGVNQDEIGKYIVADAVRLAQNDVNVVSIDRAISQANKNNSTPQADITAHVTITVNLSE